METKEAINKFKEKNGGIITYTIKELLAGLHEKIDEFRNDYNNHVEDSDVRQKKNEKKTIVLETLVGIHTILIIGLLWFAIS